MLESMLRLGGWGKVSGLKSILLVCYYIRLVENIFWNVILMDGV